MGRSDAAAERLLDMLATLCRDSLLGRAPALIERSGPILRTLLRHGFGQPGGKSLADELQKRVLAKTLGASTSERRIIAHLTRQVQEHFDHVIQARTPDK